MLAQNAIIQHLVKILFYNLYKKKYQIFSKHKLDIIYFYSTNIN